MAANNGKNLLYKSSEKRKQTKEKNNNKNYQVRGTYCKNIH